MVRKRIIRKRRRDGVVQRYHVGIKQKRRKNYGISVIGRELDDHLAGRGYADDDDLARQEEEREKIMQTKDFKELFKKSKRSLIPIEDLEEINL